MSSAAEKCAVCGKPVEGKLAPFCSKRCADIDLGRWLKGSYSIPGTPAEDEGGKDDATDESGVP
jgi:endogenous inhibitor of DNA gyrase (YacG/DUF329 family)